MSDGERAAEFAKKFVYWYTQVYCQRPRLTDGDMLDKLEGELLAAFAAVRAETREEDYAAVKRAFVFPLPDENGRPYSDVSPAAQARIKAAIRALAKETTNG